MEVKEFEIWIEGYSATGEYSPARYEGKFDGANFKQACMNMMMFKKWDLSYYNEKNNSYWACRFFDNEADARKSFG